MSYVGGVITPPQGIPDPRSRSFNLLIAAPQANAQPHQPRSVLKIESLQRTKLSSGAQAFSIQ